MEPGDRGPLHGVRVLEFSQIVAGPMCGSALAELGADVIKVEPPEGDPHRTRGAVVPRESKTFQALNRGKRSLVIDLKTEEGRAVVHRLAQDADVALANYRLGVAERLGIDEPTLRGINPRLVYWQNTGFGETGPYADRPGSDLSVQAYSGLMASIGKTDADGLPASSTIPFADVISGIAGAMGVVAALYAREQGTDTGQYISTSLLRSSMWAQVRQVMREPVHDASLRDPMMEQVHRLHRAGTPYREIVEVRERLNPVLGAGMLYYTAYQASDGVLVLGALTPRARDQVRILLGITEDESDLPHYDSLDPAYIAQADRVRAALAAGFRAESVHEWLALLEARGVPASPLQFAEDLADDPQVEATGGMVDLVHAVTGPQRVVAPIVELSATPTSVPRPAPALGEHSVEVLTEFGYNGQEIDLLISSGVVVARS